jgi:hypothetical protein
MLLRDTAVIGGLLLAMVTSAAAFPLPHQDGAAGESSISARISHRYCRRCRVLCAVRSSWTPLGVYRLYSSCGDRVITHMY